MQSYGFHSDRPSSVLHVIIEDDRRVVDHTLDGLRQFPHGQAILSAEHTRVDLDVLKTFRTVRIQHEITHVVRSGA